MMTADKPLRVVITGASSGIGAALARRYAARGAVLGLIARRESVLRTLSAELGAQCDIYGVDVRAAGELAACAQHFMGRRGTPHIVIANAGVSVGSLVEHAEDLSAFADVINTNVLGLVNTFHPFVAPMRTAGAGALVGIASVAGYRGLPGAAAYSASKAAAIACLESLRVELRSSGLRVITVCPGYVATAMTEKNPYPMPFMLSAEAAAAKIDSIVERRKAFAVIPWQMAIVARVLRALPNCVYDRIFARAPRKPRRSAPGAGGGE